MSEQKMLRLAQEALGDFGIDDTLIVAGQFEPRGRSGAMFAGAMLGSSVAGDLGGSAAEGLGLGAGMVAGGAAHQAGSALPPFMIVAASVTAVYGMHSKARWKKPVGLEFVVPRAGLTVEVHQRVNVRTLALIHEDTGSSIELEGSRVPITHSKDVIEVLRSASEEQD